MSMLSEAEEKCQAECANQVLMGQSQGVAGVPAQGWAPTDKCITVSLAEQLRGWLNRESKNTQQMRHALRILEAHPEFEELLWLLRSGVV